MFNFIKFGPFKKDLKDVEKPIEKRNVFEEIASQLLDLIIIETSVIPLNGSVINEGDEFILKVIIGIKILYFNKSPISFFINTPIIFHDSHIQLIFTSNCSPKGSGKVEKYVKTSSETDYRNRKYTHIGNVFSIYNLPDLDYNYPLEIEYSLRAANSINRKEPLAIVQLHYPDRILLMRKLTKTVIIGNEIVQSG